MNNDDQLKHDNEFGIKPDQSYFSLEVLQKSTYGIKYFISHLRTHHGVKLYQCSKCEKPFSHTSNLISYLRIHTGEHPYQCTQCDQSFSENSSHNRDKLYQCSQCEKAFSHNSNLISHLRIHTGENPFKCTQCDNVTHCDLYCTQCALWYTRDLAFVANETNFLIIQLNRVCITFH